MGGFSCLGQGFRGFKAKLFAVEGSTVQAHLLLMIAKIRLSWALSRDILQHATQDSFIPQDYPHRDEAQLR